MTSIISREILKTGCPALTIVELANSSARKVATSFITKKPTIVRRSIRMAHLIAVSLLASVQPASSFAQDDGGFRFVADSRGGSGLNEVSIPPGLPEGFDRQEFLVAISDGELSNAMMGWFSFGDTRSRSVTVLLPDETPPRLFVDLDRDRKLKPAELIASSPEDPNVWRVDLDAEFVQPDGAPKHQRQQVRVRFQPDSRKLMLSASGSMTGSVEFEGQQRLAKYVDRDANGRWFDADDRLFVDLNGDGKLDPLLERLPCQGMRQIAGQLYAISGDNTGQRLKIEAVHDRGSIVPVVNLEDSTALVTSLEASLASDSGMQVRFEALDVPVEVPVGIWNVAKLRITVQGAAGTYSFVFENLDPKANPQVVEADATIDFDLLGKLRITATTSTMDEGDDATRIVTPLLRTASGLYLANSKTGLLDASNENRLIARSFSAGSQFHIGSTGFT